MQQIDLPFDSPILPLLTPDEILVHADQSLLARLREDRRIEFKSFRVDPRQLGDYHSMWANTKASGGLIAVGIEKDGIVSGCASLDPARLNDLEKAGKDYCPECRSETSRIPVTNATGLDDFVLLIRVPYREDKVVRTVSGEAFIRIGRREEKAI